MRKTCLIWILSFLSTLSASAIKKGWVTESPLPVSSAPAPPLETSPTPALNSTPSASNASLLNDDDYYSPYPDYQDLLLNSSEEERRLVEVALPDNSLADTDLHDHDLIDSVMYIYFGGTSRQEGLQGKQPHPHQTTVVVVGAVIGLVAQLLTLAGALRRVTSRDPPLLIIINTEVALAIADLIFIFGVQSTRERWECELVALSLHYLHLVVSSWLTSNCVYLHLKLRDPGRPPRLLLHFALAWGLPVPAVYVCNLLEGPGYELRDYCWLSIERGMLLSFMAPISLLMLLNTWLAVGGLQLAGKADEADRKALRVGASLLPLFAVSWFFGVLALENSASLAFSLLFLASHSFLSWFMYICWLPGERGPWRDTEEDDEDEEEDLIFEEVKSGTDDQPLLLPRDELQMDPICTISS